MHHRDPFPDGKARFSGVSGESKGSKPANEDEKCAFVHDFYLADQKPACSYKVPRQVHALVQKDPRPFGRGIVSVFGDRPKTVATLWAGPIRRLHS